MRQKIVYYGAILCNLGLVGFAAFLFVNTWGPEKLLSLLILIPAILSLMAIIQGPDLEERKLNRRLRKAQTRKALKELEEFDPQTQKKS